MEIVESQDDLLDVRVVEEPNVEFGREKKGSKKLNPSDPPGTPREVRHVI